MSELRIRLLTANLLDGRAHPEAFARQLLDLQVDAVALQELGPEQAVAVAEVLPHGKLEPGTKYMGMGIALRHPGEVKRLPLRHRDARVAELSPSDWPLLSEPLEIVNVHLQAPHSLWPWTGFLRRRAQVRGVESYLISAPRRCRVLLGDLNATPLWPAYRRLAARIPDAVRAHARASGRRPARTWAPWPGAPRLLRIDHVFASGVQIFHVERVPVAGSDHSGILVDLVPVGGARSG